VTLIDAVALALALLTGTLVGTFYFGTLWLVVRRLDRLAWPALWLAVTGIVRLAVVLALFAWLVGTHWERLVLALIGFVVIRVVLTRWLGRPADAPRRPRREGMATGGGT
jgi:F1F0 ATPase subunit 2